MLFFLHNNHRLLKLCFIKKTSIVNIYGIAIEIQNGDINDDKFIFHAHEKYTYVYIALFISIYHKQYKITEKMQVDAFEFNVKCQKVTDDDKFRFFG